MERSRPAERQPKKIGTSMVMDHLSEWQRQVEPTMQLEIKQTIVDLGPQRGGCSGAAGGASPRLGQRLATSRRGPPATAVRHPGARRTAASGHQYRRLRQLGFVKMSPRASPRPCMPDYDMPDLAGQAARAAVSRLRPRNWRAWSKACGAASARWPRSMVAEARGRRLWLSWLKQEMEGSARVHLIRYPERNPLNLLAQIWDWARGHHRSAFALQNP